MTSLRLAGRDLDRLRQQLLAVDEQVAAERAGEVAGVLDAGRRGPRRPQLGRRRVDLQRRDGERRRRTACGRDGGAAEREQHRAALRRRRAARASSRGPVRPRAGTARCPGLAVHRVRGAVRAAEQPAVAHLDLDLGRVVQRDRACRPERRPRSEASTRGGRRRRSRPPPAPRTHSCAVRGDEPGSQRPSVAGLDQRDDERDDERDRHQRERDPEPVAQPARRRTTMPMSSARMMTPPSTNQTRRLLPPAPARRRCSRRDCARRRGASAAQAASASCALRRAATASAAVGQPACHLAATATARGVRARRSAPRKRHRSSAGAGWPAVWYTHSRRPS